MGSAGLSFPRTPPRGVAPVVALMMVQTQSEVFEKFGHPGDARARFGSADPGDGLGVLIFAFLGSLRNLRGFPSSFPSRAVGKRVSGSLHSLEAPAPWKWIPSVPDAPGQKGGVNAESLA